MTLSALSTSYIRSASLLINVADGTNHLDISFGTLPATSITVTQVVAMNQGASDRTLVLGVAISTHYHWLGSVVVPAQVSGVPGTVNVLAALPAAYQGGFPMDAANVNLAVKVNAAVAADSDIRVFASVQY